jgi:hypothetical protein
VAQFDCHPEQALFAQRGIWASRAMRRVLCDAIIARLACFRIKLSHYPGRLALLVPSFDGRINRAAGQTCGNVISNPHLRGVLQEVARRIENQSIAALQNGQRR